MGASRKFVYLRLFLCTVMSSTDSRKFSKFPLKDCLTGNIDLLIVTDAGSKSDSSLCSETTQSFVPHLIAMFGAPPWDPSQTRLRVNVASYSPVTSRTLLYSNSGLNPSQLNLNTSTTSNCSNTALNQHPRQWSVLPIVDFVQKYFNQGVNTNVNTTRVAIMVVGGPNPGAVEEVGKVQKGVYNMTQLSLFVIMVNFQEEVSKIALIPDTLHMRAYSELSISQLMSLSICSQCNPGWFIWEHQGSLNQISCYLLDIDGDFQSWINAYSKCENFGSSLASLETQGEIDFIEEKLSEKIKLAYTNDSFSMFIGLKRDYKSVSNGFGWLSGNPLITSHWADKRPNVDDLNLKCGLWVFKPPGANVTLNKTESDVSVSKTMPLNGWEDIACGVRMSNASLCEFITDVSRDDVSRVDITAPNLISVKNTLEKGEFVEYNGAVVSLAANVKNTEFYSSFETLHAEFKLFSCKEGDGSNELISFSYVCDHKRQCSNGRDESICLYRTCDPVKEFQCRSRQCVPRESRCDAYSDCYDNSDEEDCMECNQMRACDGKCFPEHWFSGSEENYCNSWSGEYEQKVKLLNKDPCAFICNRTSCIYPHQLGDGVVNCLGPEGHLDETIGKLERFNSCVAADEKKKWAPLCIYLKDRYGRIIGCKDKSHLWNCQSFQCPDGYVKCPDSYCIPMHLVRDSEPDCPLGQDELGPKDQNCSGNFACFESLICLHPDLVCDGYPQCPGGDDELNCQVTCADGSQCISGTTSVMGYDLNSPLQNLNFVDSRTRLLDLSGADVSSAIISQDVTHLKNLITIYIPYCKISSVDNIFSSGISNLQTVYHFDISYNIIQKISKESAFRYMANLRILDLSYNAALADLEGEAFLPYYRKSLLEILDLSSTAISVLHNSVLQGLNSLKLLNLSNTRITNIQADFFPKDFMLSTLDLRENPIVGYDTSSFNGLSIRTSLYTDSFGLCCPQIRGRRIPQHTCKSPDDTISSCSHLVRQEVQRALLWFVGVVAVLGNITVIFCRILWNRGVIKKAYGIFVTSLGISDLIMGVYLLIIACADFYYKSEYVLNTKVWKESTTCQIAGFLSTLSSETSAFFTLLVTLDRFLVMKFPFGNFNFSRHGMFAATAIVWSVGFILAAIPILPPFSDWTVYSSNGMCLGLPFSEDMLAGWKYSVFVFVALNSAVFLVIVVGQFSIYRAMSENRVTVSNGLNDHNRRAQDIVVARQLSLVVLLNFLCWFPIGLMGLLALTGHELGKSAYTWTAILVMPINSALNPMLYTIPALRDKWNQFRNHAKHQLKRNKLNKSKEMADQAKHQPKRNKLENSKGIADQAKRDKFDKSKGMDDPTKH